MIASRPVLLPAEVVLGTIYGHRSCAVGCYGLRVDRGALLKCMCDDGCHIIAWLRAVALCLFNGLLPSMFDRP